MVAGKPIDLGVIRFEKQGDATAHFRTMLGRYRSGEVVSDADRVELAELLKRHPEYAEKFGCGIRHFEVMAAEYGTQCFRIVRLDNSSDRFSYPACVSGRGRP